MKTYSYKDGSRMYWTITITNVEQRGVDYIWRYDVRRSMVDFTYNGEVFWTNEILGQYDIVPSATEVITDMLSHISAMCIHSVPYWKESN